MNEPTADRKRIVDRSRDAATLDISGISVGQAFSVAHRFEWDEVDRFAELCGDYSPLHVDDDYACTTEFGGRVVHGMLLASLFSTLVGMKIPGRRALYIGQELKFRRPVMVGEAVTATATVAAVNAKLGIVQLTMAIRKADGSVAVNGAGKVRIRESAPPVATVVEDTPFDALTGPPVALVTGGGRGIGAAIAQRLARDGFAVVVNYRSNQASAERLVKEIHAEAGNALAIQADILNDAALQAMVGEITEKFNRLDLLVNNASPGFENKSVEELAWDDVLLQIDASVRAPLMLSQALFPMLRESGGSIVNIISQFVENSPPPHMLDYVLGKYGLLGLTRGLAVEWASAGVRVNGVTPSVVETDMTNHLNDRFFRLEASRTPLRRIASAEDIAAAVSYLGGENASFLTGVVMPVTGGQVMK
jgi:3-oxoacyl-[acyl-carrier protein] reductase